MFNKKDTSKKEKIIVSEVTHSIFYSPWYVALNNGYLDKYDIEVILTSGANNVIASILSDDANIGLCGPEAAIYIYNSTNKDSIQAFAGLTKRDGQFLVLKNDIKYTNLKDIEGLTILGGRTGGMPLINFKEALKNENINNVIIDDTVDFANLSSSFISSNASGVNLFEPNATLLEKNGYGYIADSIGTYSTPVPYTTFNAKKSYINSNKELIKYFYEGINKGIEYVKTHSSTDIANIITKEFPDIAFNDLVKMIDNYKNADTYLDSPYISEELFENLEDMLISNNLLTEKVPYKDLVYEVTEN